MRVGKQFFHGGVADLGTHAVLHVRLKVGLRGQLLHILERGDVGRQRISSVLCLTMGCRQGTARDCGRPWVKRFGFIRVKRLLR